MDGVYVTLKIYEEVKIPSACAVHNRKLRPAWRPFRANRSRQGREVITAAPGRTPSLRERGESGIGDVTEQAGALLSNIQEAVGNINKIAQKLNTDVFKETTIANLHTTLSNLKETSSSFAEASKKIDGVVKKAEGAIETGQQTFASAKSAADELKKTIGDVRSDVRSLVQQAKQGRGALGRIAFGSRNGRKPQGACCQSSAPRSFMV